MSPRSDADEPVHPTRPTGAMVVLLGLTTLAVMGVLASDSPGAGSLSSDPLAPPTAAGSPTTAAASSHLWLLGLQTMTGVVALDPGIGRSGRCPVSWMRGREATP